MMTKYQNEMAFFGLLLGPLFLLGCDTDTDDTSSGNDGRDGDKSTESSPDTADTDTGTRTPVCDLDALETFDSGLPEGWSVSKAGFVAGSGSGSGGDTEIDPDETWHHTTVEAEGELAPEGMDGGYMTVGGNSDMFEALYTDFYSVDECESISLSFTHFFDDLPTNDMDRGELWITVDGPPWIKLATYNENDMHEETIDLSDLLRGAFTFQLEFVFVDEDQGSNEWAIDNFELVGSL